MSTALNTNVAVPFEPSATVIENRYGNVGGCGINAELIFVHVPSVLYKLYPAMSVSVLGVHVALRLRVAPNTECEKMGINTRNRSERITNRCLFEGEDMLSVWLALIDFFIQPVIKRLVLYVCQKLISDSVFAAQRV